MATQMQGAIKTKEVLLTTTALPVGFTTATLSGTWTSAALGTRGYLLTGTNGAAIAEVTWGSGVNTSYDANAAAPAPQHPEPTKPFFGWVYLSGVLTEILAVQGNNSIVVKSNPSASSSTLTVVTTQIDCPSQIDIINKDSSSETITITYPENTAVAMPVTSNIYSIGDKTSGGTLNPVLIKTSGTLAVAQITY